MRLRSALLFLTLPVLLLPAGADPTTKPTPLPPRKLTLAQVLASLPPPADGGLLLSVSAEQVTLPDGADAPPADASASDVAAAFGDQTMRFGAVTAVAPSAMTLLNTQPDAPDLAASLSYSAAFKMLAASLDDAQWQALTSERGLGLSDLSNDTQRGLFHALFLRGELWIGSEDPALTDVPQEKRTDVQNVSDQIDATRVRLGQTAHLYLYNTEGSTIFDTLARPDGAQRLHVFHPKYTPSPTENGVALAAAVPNTLKSSDLDYDSPALQILVTAAGAATVGDLVTRLGKETKLEMYADPHYAARTLTVQGTAAEPASDLLQALCVCVTGTFRKVGPAYVLTDDLAGVGTRRKRLSDWEDEAFYATTALRDHAGSAMLHHHGADARKLPTFGDPLAVTPEELAALPDDSEMPGLPESYGKENSQPVAKMSSAQQAWTRQAAAEYNEKLRTNPEMAGRPEADATHNADLSVHYQVQFVVPGQSLPVDAFSSPLFILYYPGEAEGMANAAPKLREEQAKALAKLPPAPPLSTTLHLSRCRAVLGHPRSVKDVDALVAAMQTPGLNTLLLDVFSNGVSHIKTNGASGPDILTEALARTRGTGISVYADLSLLTWGDAPPEPIQDLTIDGQNSRQAAIAAIQAHQINPQPDYDYSTGKPIPFLAPPVAVSPSSPQVQAALTALVQDLAARPGLAGFVWENAEADSGLGYTLGSRLGFLRSAHADPVDLTEADGRQAKTNLPLFDNAAIDTAINALWTKAQAQANTDLLVQLRLAAQTSRVTLPILMEQGWNTFPWYASWDDPQSQPPALRELTFNNNYDENVAGIKQVARAQGRIVLRREAIDSDGDIPALARKLQDDAKTLPGDGFVLDFTHDEATQGAAPLDSLVQAVSTESRQAGGKTEGKTVN